LQDSYSDTDPLPGKQQGIAAVPYGKESARKIPSIFITPSPKEYPPSPVMFLPATFCLLRPEFSGKGFYNPATPAAGRQEKLT
jgi:hypothetical protein